MKTGLGTTAGWHITSVMLDEKGQREGRRMTLWMSADARRLPLRLEVDLVVGKFQLVLRQASGVLP